MKKQKNIVVLGAGITGLATAYYLSKDYNVIVIEKEKEVGGMSTSFKYKDFILDYGPHKLYTQISKIMEEIEKITPLLKIKKKNSIYVQGNFFDFPLSIKQVLMKMPFKAFQAGLDVFSKTFNKLPDDSYENFLINRFGKTLYNLSFRDYAEKVWNSNPSDLDKELAKKRVVVSSIFELIKSILFKNTKKISVEYFYYPPKGIKQMIDSLVKKIKQNKGKIIRNAKITEIKINQNKITSLKIRNKAIKSDFVVSTIPLQDLIIIIKPKVTSEIREAAKNLFYKDLNIIYFILNKKKALKDSWIFFPERKFLFHRIGEQKSFSQNTCPKEKTALIVETTKQPSKENINKIKNQLVGLDLFKDDEIEEIFIKNLKRAYPIYKKGFQKHLNLVLEYVDKIENLITLGRQGLFNYNNIDHCWDMAIKAAEHIKNNNSKQDWRKMKSYFDEYRIVD